MVVVIMMHQHQLQLQQTTTQPINPPSLRSPHSQSQLPSALSLAHRPHQPPTPPTPRPDHVTGPLASIPAAHPSGEPVTVIMTTNTTTTSSLGKVRLSDLLPYDGVPSGPYIRAVEALSGSLMRHNAVVIELGTEDASLMRCGLESARLYFRSRAHSGGSWGKGGSRGVYMYRAGRALEDMDSSPPCMADVFRCMGKVARASLCAIARHLRLRSDVFNHLLDDNPLLANEASSSVLVASYAHMSLQNGKGAIGGGKLGTNFEVEKGLLTLVSSDAPGLQVARNNSNKEPSLRSVLSDSLSGAFLEDAMLVSCGHSFGGLMLRKVLETARCTLCNTDIQTGSLIPNHALRAAAAAVKHEDDRRLFHNASLRKRRKEVGDHRENGDTPIENGSLKGVQYPFSVNEKVVIKGNRRTPDKFMGKEAIITSQCLNGWYLLKIIESGENVRLQYRSLRKIPTTSQAEEDRQTSIIAT